MKQLFTQNHLLEIEEAIKTAETKTNGEIVPVVVEMSNEYAAAKWRSVAIFQILGILIVYTLSSTRWWLLDLQQNLILILLFGIISMFLANWVPAFKRLFILKTEIEKATWQMAETHFIKEDMFNTKERTGLLIFISLFEHRVVLLADKGIRSVVEQADLDKIVSAITTNFKAKHPKNGILEAITMCSELLTKKGFIPTDNNNPNELTNTLRINLN